jgi:hypothetical protein
MNELTGKMQDRFKQSSTDIMGFALKLVSCLVLSLTLALIVHEVLGKKEGEATLSFFFMIVVFTAVFMRVAKKWSLTGVLIFDLVCILIGIVLKLYIMVAPGT